MPDASPPDAADACAWITLSRTPALGARRLLAALDALGGPASVARGSPAALAAAGLPERARRYLAGDDAAPRAAELRWLEHPEHHLLPCTDARYPPLLAGTPDPPVALYVEGRVEAMSDPLLAMVGSRSPTAQGLDTAFDFAHYFAERGLGIVSGLAAGIDTAAHRGALRAGGATLAVLGTGVDVVYPRGNAALSAQIRGRGALISEIALGSPPQRRHFPRRNRLIAGLSLGCLVVEAARGSGSLITARRAGDYGRQVFAVPGSIHNPTARGCHALIKDGATLVENAEDVLKELNFSAVFGGAAPASDAPARHGAGGVGMDKDQKILLDALGFDPANLDLLVVRTGFKPEVVSSMMLILELEGHVQTAPGGRYSRVVNRRAGGER